MAIFIIEHLEPKVWKWCLIEYESISKLVGKNNLWFTNIKKKSEQRTLGKFGSVFSDSVAKLHLDSKQMCVLDPESSVLLKSSDAKEFKYFVFGGILGDYPPKKRTKKELTKFLSGAKTRNIGKKQFSTDNAVFVSYEILNGKKFGDLKFINNPELKISKYSSVNLPFLYPLVDGKPRMSPKIISYLKHKKGF